MVSLTLKEILERWVDLNPKRPIEHFSKLHYSKEFKKTKAIVLDHIITHPSVKTSEIIDFFSSDFTIDKILEALNMLQAEEEIK